MHSKVLGIDFFLMQMAKIEKCLKLWRAVLIPTTVEPVGDVVGRKTDLSVHRILFVMHCVMIHTLRGQKAY